jgi:hypothetical protein
MRAAQFRARGRDGKWESDAVFDGNWMAAGMERWWSGTLKRSGSSIIAGLSLLLATMTGCQTPPRVAMSVSPGFDFQVKRHSYPKGANPWPPGKFGNDEMARMLWESFRTKYPTSTLTGRWIKPQGGEWEVKVERGAAPWVLRSLLAEDGYQADLGSMITTGGPRLYPRFRHKQFSWGPAVSAIVQYGVDRDTQIPHNGGLYYEVAGVTSDRRHTIHARFEVTHPQLGDEGSARYYPGTAFPPDAPIRRDPSYLLLERCSDNAFHPGIDEIDAMLETLRLE